MSTKIFQNYRNSGFFLTIEEVKARIEDLTTSLESSECYYRANETEVLTRPQREDILLENEIRDEIDFYEEQLSDFNYPGQDFSDEEDFTNNQCLEEKKTLPSLPNADIIQHYHNSSLSISIVEAKQIIQDLERDLKGHRHYCKSSVRTFTEKEKEQQQEKDVNIQHEICYYETNIFRTQQQEKDDAQSLLRPRYHWILDSDNDEEESESIWPTHCQGNTNEEEIRLLKQQVAKLEETVASLVRIMKEQVRIDVLN